MGQRCYRIVNVPTPRTAPSILFWLNRFILARGIATSPTFGGRSTSSIPFSIPCYFPFREYRLIYPLLPFCLGFLLRGLTAAYRRLRFIRFGGVQLILSLAILSYLAVDLALISGNLGRHRVYRRQAEEGGWEDYPQQLADWGGAGEWLRGNAAPDALVVGGRKELYLLSRRRMVFEGQYGAVLGAFEEALGTPGVEYLVSETTSGLPAAHRMMVHAGEYDFDLARRLAGIDIYRVRRFPGRTREVPPPDYTQVIAAAHRRAEKFPYSFEAHNELGYLAFKTGDYPAAIQSFTAALKLNPDAGMTRFNLAAAYLDSGESGPAARELKRCLTMPHADLLFDLVRVNLKIAELQISIEAQPLHPENYLRLLEVAGLYYSQKEYTQALRYIDRSLALNPQFADAYFFQGLCQEAQGKREEARFAYWTALRCNPAFSPARARLDALEESNNWDVPQ